MKKLVFTFLMTASLSLLAGHSFAEEITKKLTVVVPDVAPQGLSQPVNGLVGSMVESVTEACKRAHLQCEIEWVPWARAVEEVKMGEDILVSGFSRFPEREPYYTWIFPVFKMDRAFIAPGPAVNSYDEAKKRFKSVGATNGSADYTALLKEGGFAENQITPLTVRGKEMEMLSAGHIDAWFTPTSEVKWRLKQQPEFAGKFTIGAPMFSTDQYIACSKKCNPEIVSKLQKALEEMKADGTIDNILKKYE